jgi:hypothetical protein
MPWNDGILECWNTEYGGVRSIFIMDGTDQKIKPDNHPLLVLNIPFFHYSSIPLDVLRQTPPLWGEINAGFSGLGFFS